MACLLDYLGLLDAVFIPRLSLDLEIYFNRTLKRLQLFDLNEISDGLFFNLFVFV